MINKTVLDNGVRIVTETMPAVHSVSVGIWVTTGSRHERADENGVAHFIEHMLFKGTQRHSAGEIARIVDSVGGVFNAFTAKEYTCFYIKVLQQHFDLVVDVLSDIFFHSLFQPEEIEKERNVILQEISMIKDTPDDYVQDLFSQAYFGRHPLGYNILGDSTTVQGFSRKHITDFYDREYLVPERIIIAAAGNISHQQMLENFASRFAHLTGHAAPCSPAPVPRRHTAFHYRSLEQVHVCLGTLGVSHLNPDRYALYAANAILGGSMSSRLFQEIRENRGLAYSIYSFTASFYDTGVFGVYMGVDKQTLREALQIILATMAQLRDQCVDGAELRNAQEQLKGNMLLALESTDSRMSRLAKCEIYYQEYIPVDEVIRGIDALTAEDIQALTRSLLKDEYCIYTFFGPVRKKDISADMLVIG